MRRIYIFFVILLFVFNFFLISTVFGVDIFLELKSGGRKTNILIYPTDDAKIFQRL